MIYCREDGSTLGGRSRADIEMGARIRMRRKELGLSQGQVAEEIGWFVAQVDDCESGLLRPPSRDLFLLADLLNVEVSYFTEGLERPLTSAADLPDLSMPPVESATGIPQELHGHAGAIELFCIYARIKDTRSRRFCSIWPSPSRGTPDRFHACSRASVSAWARSTSRRRIFWVGVSRPFSTVNGGTSACRRTRSVTERRRFTRVTAAATAAASRALRRHEQAGQPGAALAGDDRLGDLRFGHQHALDLAPARRSRRPRAR